MFSKLASPFRLSSFSISLWLTLAMFFIFCVAFANYVDSEKQIDRANQIRFQSYQLADELRQSSDDLTRMVRMYIATGNPIYKRHYQEIIDIRDGKKPRPINYQDIYWDLVQDDDRRPRPAGRAVPLLELMRQAGFTPQEFARLAQAKANSDALTRTEFAAIALIESSPSPSDSARIKAMQMLTDMAYHQAKAGIMRPISEFYQMMDKRTLSNVQISMKNALHLRAVFIMFGLILIFMLWCVYRALKETLGSSLEELYASIARLGQGDFASPLPLAKGMQNSVLDWLAQTQSSLFKIDTERKEAEARNKRLTQLYIALSQCSQAIVRCDHEAELFPHICRSAVEFGGMKMAWIGLLDEQDGHLKPIDSYGDGTEYLRNLQISIDPGLASGMGPSGTAFRENRPVWCQDFMHHPSTAAWREQAARFGWRASAALPLLRKGEVVGTFNLYAKEVNAFDEPAQHLLIEMTRDISHALTRFHMESKHEQLEKELVESEQRSKLVLENSIDAVINIDNAGNVIEWNSAATHIFGYAREAVLGQELAQLIIPEKYRDTHRQAMRRIADGALSSIAGKRLELEGMRQDGSEFPVEISVTTIHRDNSLFFSAFLRDISERKQAEERIQYLALYDPLTGLPNRVQLEERFQYAMSLAKRSNAHIAVMFLDLDHFKNINDTLGHNVGDKLLIEIASRLRSLLREQDTVARLGGDEFILLFPDGNEDGIRRVAEKLQTSVTQPFINEKGNELTVSSSIGIAFYPHDGQDFETLLKNADAAMYRAKHDGRNGFCFFTAQMQARSVRNLELENALRHALALDQLQLDYQPQIALADGKLIGAEALLRWHHPKLGSVAPAEFIPIAEETGLILPIGEWVLRTALRQLKTWMEQGMAPVIIAVNISAVQFRHPSLPELVTGILDELQLPPQYLELELTEGIAMHDPHSAIAIMNNLHERGIRMSIDDFGTGYSSLSYLKKFNVYKLKIDQSFVRDISTDPEDKAIVIAIINLAHSLGLKTIAEGVETVAQLSFVSAQGCDEVQGYHFSKPLSASQLKEYTEANAQSVKRGRATTQTAVNLD